MPRKSIIKRMSKLAAGDEFTTVTMDEYPEALNIHWTRFCAYIEGGETDSIEIGLTLAKSEYILIRAPQAENVSSVKTPGPGCATGGYKPFARFKDAANGKLCVLHAFGFIEE